jgi:gas vesicle protein
MGQDPNAIRQQIEQTRERMGDTVDALGYKADVPARAKESVSEKVGSLKAKVSGAGSGISAATPDADDVKQGARQAAGVAQENPIGLAIGAAAVGFMAGMLIPSTRVENERLGPVSDQVKEQARQTGQEALEHGRQIAGDTAQVATDKLQEAATEVKEAAQTSAQDHAEQMSESAQESVHQVGQSVGSGGPTAA